MLCNPNVAEAETVSKYQEHNCAVCISPSWESNQGSVPANTGEDAHRTETHTRPKGKDIPTMSDHSRGPPGSTPETRRARALSARRPGVLPRRRDRGRAPRARAAVTPQSAGGEGSRRFRGGGVRGRGSRASRSDLLQSSPPPSFPPSVPGPEQPSAPHAP